MPLPAPAHWANLNPLPVPNSAVQVETKASIFSREFPLLFTAKRKDGMTWLDASRALGTLTVTPPAFSTCITLSPGGGDQFAEIAIYEGGTKVGAHVYWS